MQRLLSSLALRHLKTVKKRKRKRKTKTKTKKKGKKGGVHEGGGVRGARGSGQTDPEISSFCYVIQDYNLLKMKIE